MLLHGIMSSIAEFYSWNLSTEIIKGTSKKVQRGGYPGMKPLGYSKVQDLSGGNELCWIEADAERASHITWAFETYASGDFTLRQLAEALAERGFDGQLRDPHWEQLQRNLRRALALSSNLGSAYVKAGQKVRRQMNRRSSRRS